MKNLPSLKDLHADLSTLRKDDELTVLLNNEPKADWIKVHPYIKGYKYIPIERIEYLLKRIFRRYRIEILREGTAFNGVYTVVRVHYLNPVSGEWDYHDGIGAAQLQTKKGQSPADLAAINNGALAMAFPISKTIAIKDACDHFGKLFGADLNRDVQIKYSLDLTIIDFSPEHPNWEKAKSALASGSVSLEKIKEVYNLTPENEAELLK